MSVSKGDVYDWLRGTAMLPKSGPSGFSRSEVGLLETLRYV
jgi:hypothetical protein